jgi:hypothetical protein
MQLITQEQFVKDCMDKYWFTDIPADQKWEEAHFPLPISLGGEDTVLLWSADHTVQGLLQSVECDHQCFHGYRNKHDTDLLTFYYPEYLQLFAQLKSQFSKRRGKKSAAINKANSTGIFASDMQSASGKKGAAINKANGTGCYDPKVRSAGAAAQHAQKYKCLVTEFISTPCGLSHYQKARGIDTKLRVKVSITPLSS